jgi:hypothetical protein
MFENKRYNDIHATRYIASWFNSGGGRWMGDFEDWLMSLGLTAEEARYIWNMATCGKLELEMNAEKFIGELRKTLEDEC